MKGENVSRHILAFIRLIQLKQKYETIISLFSFLVVSADNYRTNPNAPHLLV